MLRIVFNLSPAEKRRKYAIGRRVYFLIGNKFRRLLDGEETVVSQHCVLGFVEASSTPAAKFHLCSPHESS